MTVNLQSGTQYFFDVTVRSMNLFEKMSGGRVQIKPAGAQDTELVDVPHSFNATGRQGYFGTGWHGWGVAGYRGDGTRRTAPIDQAKFRLTNPDGSAFEDSGDACQALTGGPCRTNTDGMTFPGDYSGATPGDPGEFDPASAESQIKEAYAYIPTRAQAAPGSPIDEAWTGPKPTHRGTAAGLQSSRLGEDVPSVDVAAGGLVDPPTLRGQAAPTFALTGGVGPATASFGMGWSDSDVGFMDMNGDGFPDTVQADSIKFTDRPGRAMKTYIDAAQQSLLETDYEGGVNSEYDGAEQFGTADFDDDRPLRPINWNLLTADEALAEWMDLDKWVDWLRKSFGLPPTVVPPLWHRHDELVWELSAVHTHWLNAYDPEGSPSGPNGWLRDFAEARNRLREWVSTAGCRLDRDRPTR